MQNSCYVSQSGSGLFVSAIKHSSYFRRNTATSVPALFLYVMELLTDEQLIEIIKSSVIQYFVFEVQEELAQMALAHCETCQRDERDRCHCTQNLLQNLRMPNVFDHAYSNRRTTARLAFIATLARDECRRVAENQHRAVCPARLSELTNESRIAGILSFRSVARRCYMDIYGVLTVNLELEEDFPLVRCHGCGNMRPSVGNEGQ